MAVNPSMIGGWLKERESNLLEFKREWYELSSKAGKAEFVKDVLALANSTVPTKSGFLVIGIEDDGEERLVGVPHSPTAEQLAQILASWIEPVPDVSFQQVDVSGTTIDVLEVAHAPFRPYYAIRDFPQVLSTNLVYVRRGPTIGTLTIPELEIMIRQKGAILKTVASSDPVVSGFIEIPNAGSPFRLVGRVQNISDRPVILSTVWNVVWARDARAVYRRPSFSGRTLYPGEAVEDENDLSSVYFYVEGTQVARGTDVGNRLFDVRWNVHYRDHQGFFQSAEHFILVAD